MTQDKSKWYMVDYGNNHFGLKMGDEKLRGIPEGTKEEWLDLIKCISNNIGYYKKRLAYFPYESIRQELAGIFSPRNTNYLIDCFIIEEQDAKLIESLLYRAIKIEDDLTPPINSFYFTNPK